MTDAKHFLYIFGVFVLAYGIVRYVILGTGGNHASTSLEIIFIPYMQIYGELFLDYPQENRK